MMPPSSIEAAGPGITLQDGGRHGYLRYGITAAGPMDPLMHATANRAAGNPLDATAIEISTGGVTRRGRGRRRSGSPSPRRASASPSTARPLPRRRRADPGARPDAWSCGPATRAPGATSRCQGRLDVAPVLGSTGDPYPLGPRRPRRARARRRRPPPGGRGPPWRARAAQARRARGSTATAGRSASCSGPQDDYFAPDQIAAFLAGPWTVSPRGDRMACFLDGTPLKHAKGHDIVSDGVAMGAIQVPGNGLPIVLMADRQSTGGYPKIATVIGPDLGRLAQVRGGARIAFRRVIGGRGGGGAPRRARRSCASRSRGSRWCGPISRPTSCSASTSSAASPTGSLWSTLIDRRGSVR